MNCIEFVNFYGLSPKLKSLPQIFENENACINEMGLINGFGRASLGFGLDPLTGSGRAQGLLHSC